MEPNSEQSPAQPPVQPALPEKPNPKPRIILLIVLLFLITLSIGMVWWFVLQKPVSDLTQNSQTPSGQQMSPEEVMNKIKSNYSSKYKLLNIDENNHPKEGEMSIRQSQEAGFYKVQGYDYYVWYPEGGATLDLMIGPVNPSATELPYSADVALRNEIAGIFKSISLTKTDTFGELTTGSATDIYTGNGLVCEVNSPESRTSLTSASCGVVETYKTVAKEVKQFADVLDSTWGQVIFSRPKIKDSVVNGYQTASMSIFGGVGGHTALFYKVGTNSWQFFLGTQESPACFMYNTTDLRNAFKGESCYDETMEQYRTVQ